MEQFLEFRQKAINKKEIKSAFQKKCSKLLLIFPFCCPFYLNSGSKNHQKRQPDSSRQFSIFYPIDLVCPNEKASHLSLLICLIKHMLYVVASEQRSFFTVRFPLKASDFKSIALCWHEQKLRYVYQF